jgi:hypothetical protein
MSMMPSVTPPSPRGPRNAALIGVLVGVLVFALAASGFAAWKLVDNSDPSSDASPTPSVTPAPTPTVPLPRTSPSLARFYNQKLHWTKCQRDLCSKLLVPMDYANPTGKTLKLAVLKVPAQSS